MNLLEIAAIIWAASAVFNVLSFLFLPFLFTGEFDSLSRFFADFQLNWNVLVFFAPFVAILLSILWVIAIWVYVEYLTDLIVKKIRR